MHGRVVVWQLCLIVFNYSFGSRNKGQDTKAAETANIQTDELTEGGRGRDGRMDEGR